MATIQIEINQDDLLKKMSNDYLILKKGSLPSDSFLDGINQDSLIYYLENNGYEVQDTSIKKAVNDTPLSACDILFGKGASAEHVRLIEVIQDNEVRQSYSID